MNRADLNKLVQESVRHAVHRDYGKDDVTTKTFDMIQRTLKCCGAESYASWANSAYNGVGEKSQMEIGISALSPTYSVPKSCCADPDSDVCETTRKLGSLGFAASALGIVYTDGCAPKLEALLQQYLTYVSATGIGIGIIEHEPNNEHLNRADLNKLVQERMRHAVRRDYGKDDVTTKTFDMIQRTLKCCGAESYASWANSAYNGVDEKSQMEIGISALSPTYSVPKSCCADPDTDLCETTRKLGSLGFAASALGIVYTDVRLRT
ncbi:putative Tetraspanin [Daphnia magna]|uniref:Putative Tetraspanin n=1 Tax=Daphnia magna TaxID=35525 RepID=A0A164ELG2_9CRUS|nr:putative Tetraspanin [Daphnia magna]